MSTTVLYQIDEPSQWDVETPVLIVRGWCLDRRGDTVVAIEAVLASATIHAPVGLARPDVAAAFHHVPGSATSGFCFWMPGRCATNDAVTFRAVHRDGSRTELRSVRLHRE